MIGSLCPFFLCMPVSFAQLSESILAWQGITLSGIGGVFIVCVGVVFAYMQIQLSFGGLLYHNIKVSFDNRFSVSIR